MKEFYDFLRETPYETMLIQRWVRNKYSFWNILPISFFRMVTTKSRYRNRLISTLSSHQSWWGENTSNGTWIWLWVLIFG